MGSSYLSASEIVNQGCSLLRNIILARFLTKADFGVAALLGTILTLFEMTSKMALGQQVVQSRHGDNEAFLDSIHFTQLSLGVLSSLLIMAFAWPLATFVAGPQYIGSILLLGLVPLFSGLGHLEIYRKTRQLQFGRLVLAETIPQILTTLAAWPLAVFFKDYRAVLWLLLGRSLLFIAMTHLMAERRFSPKYNREWLNESLRFGWPLLLSGFVQMGNFQGDGMIVAAGYSLSQLGEFSVATTMAMAPGMLLLRVGNSIGLPLMAQARAHPEELATQYSRFLEIMAVLACASTLGMLFCGEQVIVMLYSSKYTGIGALACLLTAAQAIRIIRATVGITAMACGDTMNNLLSSSWRLTGLGLAIIVGVLHASITWFALTGFVGEVISLSVVVARLARKQALSPMLTVKPVLLGVLCIGVGIVLNAFAPHGPHLILNWLWLAAVLVLTVAAYAIVFPGLRIMIGEFSRKLKSRLGSLFPQQWSES